MLTDRVSVTDAGAITGDLVDRLASTAAFGADAEIKATARWMIRSLAAARGIRPASIHDLYMAMGRGEAGGFTVPAINVRAMAYETARAVVRSARALECRRLHLRDRAIRDRLHRAAAPRVRWPSCWLRGAARRIQRPAVHPGRSRPDQRQEVQQPRTGQGAGHACAR